MKLSDKAKRLLVLIGDYSVIEVGGQMFWVPHAGYQHCPTLDGPVLVGGAGDAAIFRSLVRHGLIQPVPNAPPYAARVTEEGRLLVEQIRMHAVYEQAVRIGLPMRHTHFAHTSTYDDRPLENADEYYLEIQDEHEFFATVGLCEGEPHQSWFWACGGVRMASWDDSILFDGPPTVEFAKWLSRNRVKGRVGATEYEFRLGRYGLFRVGSLLVVTTQIVWPETTQFLGYLDDFRLACMVADALMGRVGPGIAFDYFLDHYQDRLETVPF